MEDFRDYLIEKAFLSLSQWEAAMKDNQNQESILRLLTRLGFGPESDLLKHFSDFYRIPLVEIENYLINPSVVRMIPEHICRRYVLIALNRTNERIAIAMNDPLNVIITDEIHSRTGLVVMPFVAGYNGIMSALDNGLRM